MQAPSRSPGQPPCGRLGGVERTARPLAHLPGASGGWSRAPRSAGRGPSAEPGASVSHADRSDSPAAFSCQGSCRGLVSLCASSSLKIICFLTVTGRFGDTAALQRLPWRWRGSRLPVPRSCPGRRKSRGHFSEGKGTINTIKNESLQVQRKSGCGHGWTEEEEERGPRGSVLLPSEPSGFLREKPEPLGVSRHSQLRPQTDLLTLRTSGSGSFPSHTARASCFSRYTFSLCCLSSRLSFSPFLSTAICLFLGLLLILCPPENFSGPLPLEINMVALHCTPTICQLLHKRYHILFPP